MNNTVRGKFERECGVITDKRPKSETSLSKVLDFIFAHKARTIYDMVNVKYSVEMNTVYQWIHRYHKERKIGRNVMDKVLDSFGFREVTRFIYDPDNTGWNTSEFKKRKQKHKGL